MHDGRTRLGQDVEREVREHFPDLVFDTVIPRNVRVGRGAELRPAGDPPRSPQRRRGGVLRAGQGGGRAWLSRSRGWGGAWSAILSVSAERLEGAEEELRELPVELISPNPRQPRRALRRGVAGRRWPDRSASAACCSRCSCAPQPGGATSWSPASGAGARRSSPACRAIPALVREREDARGARARADREHGARGPQPDRGGARLRGAGRGARPHTRGGRARGSGAAAWRSATWCGCSTCPTRRSSCSQRGRSARATAGRCCSPRTTARAAAWRARRVEQGWSVRALEERARESNADQRDELGERRRRVTARTPTRSRRRATSPRRSARRSAPRSACRPTRDGRYRAELSFASAEEALELARRLRLRAVA